MRQVFIFSFLVFNTFCLLATSMPHKGIQSLIKTRVTNLHGKAAVVGIVQGNRGQIFCVEGMDGRSVTERTFFEIGSITKTLTATLLADMVVKGEAKLEDPVEKYLPPKTIVPERNGKKIQLIHLATHFSGLPKVPETYAPKDLQNPYADLCEKDLYTFLKKHKLSRDIGAVHQYSNVGFGLLGFALAKAQGKSYFHLIKNRVLDPLEMTETHITTTIKQKEYLIPGHNGLGQATKNWDIPIIEGAGALRSNGRDMMKYLKALLGQGDKSLRGAIQLSLEPQKQAKPEEVEPAKYIGLGWFSRKLTPDIEVTWSSGMTGGYRSYIGINRKTKVGVFMLVNSHENPKILAEYLLIQLVRKKISL